MKSTYAVAVACTLLIAATVAAGQQPTQPSPEQNQLAVFVGSWNYEIKGSIPASGTWAVAPVSGGHFYRATETYRPAVGEPLEITGIFGYNRAPQEYSWYRYFSNGYSDLARGWFKGGTWYWVFDNVIQGGRSARRQLTLKFVRPDYYTFTWQRSIEGGPWEVTSNGTATKSR